VSPDIRNAPCLCSAFKSPHLALNHCFQFRSISDISRFRFFSAGTDDADIHTTGLTAPRCEREPRRDFVLLKITKSRFVAGAFASALVMTAATTPAAATFDGSWTVNIITTKGTCDAGMALPIQINSGRIASTVSEVGVTGRVADHGGITVTVIQGIKRAFGIGKLADASGSGTWRGGPCSGTWTASKI
jgi:hypothetical protein